LSTEAVSPAAGPGRATPSDGFRPYVEALYHGYGTALARLLLEATAIGTDGVVGIRLSCGAVDAAREFAALGTAVRTPGATGNPTVFTIDLPGQDVAKLVAAGWMPLRLVHGISVAVRHDDWATRQQASWGAGNVEVAGHTAVLTFARAEARRRLELDVRRSGADGAIVSSMGTRLTEIEPAERHRDHVAEATVFGTAVLRTRGESAAAPGPVPVLALTPSVRVEPPGGRHDHPAAVSRPPQFPRRSSGRCGSARRPRCTRAARSGPATSARWPRSR
jgi:uncharacterized protein YbjQ (UPF0145 family)